MNYTPSQYKLKVVHYPQVPCKPFEVEVKDEIEANKICDVLADQHLFLYNNKLIPDYSNVICVIMLVPESGEDGEDEWVDYFNEIEEMEWDEFEETFLNQ